MLITLTDRLGGLGGGRGGVGRRGRGGGGVGEAKERRREIPLFTNRVKWSLTHRKSAKRQ